MSSMNNRKNLDAEMASASQGLQGPQGRKFWRSLEELAGSEAFQKLIAREFPEQGVVWSDGLSRRQFLTLMAASLALAGVGGCAVRPAPQGELVPYVHPPEGAHPVDRPLFYATAMACTGAAVGLLVESNAGRPTKIEGNPDHPASLGGTDPFHQASVLTLYDPDRAQTVTHLGRTQTWSDARTRNSFCDAKTASKRGCGTAAVERNRALADAGAADRGPLERTARGQVARLGTGESGHGLARRADGLWRGGQPRLPLRQGRCRVLAGRRLPAVRPGKPSQRGRFHGPAAGAHAAAGLAKRDDEPPLCGRDRRDLHGGQGRPPVGTPRGRNRGRGPGLGGETWRGAQCGDEPQDLPYRGAMDRRRDERPRYEGTPRSLPGVGR